MVNGGPHVYPTTQGQTDINTGDRALKVDKTQPSPVRLFVSGSSYRLLPISIPLLPKFDAVSTKKGKGKSPAPRPKSGEQELRSEERRVGKEC